MPHEVDYLLDCGCVGIERIEAAIFVPLKGEIRICKKHNKDVKIARVGNPYWVDEDQPQQDQSKEKKK